MKNLKHRFSKKFFNKNNSENKLRQLPTQLYKFDISTKQDGRLPLAYFAPSQFCKEGFYEDENVFFLEQNTPSSL